MRRIRTFQMHLWNWSKMSSVKTTIKVTPPNPSASTQFFKVKFGSSGNVAGCQ